MRLKLRCLLFLMSLFAGFCFAQADPAYLLEKYLGHLKGIDNFILSKVAINLKGKTVPTHKEIADHIMEKLDEVGFIAFNRFEDDKKNKNLTYYFFKNSNFIETEFNFFKKNNNLYVYSFTMSTREYARVEKTKKEDLIETWTYSTYGDVNLKAVPQVIEENIQQALYQLITLWYLANQPEAMKVKES